MVGAAPQDEESSFDYASEVDQDGSTRDGDARATTAMGQTGAARTDINAPSDRVARGFARFVNRGFRGDDGRRLGSIGRIALIGGNQRLHNELVVFPCIEPAGPSSLLDRSLQPTHWPRPIDQGRVERPLRTLHERSG